MTTMGRWIVGALLVACSMGLVEAGGESDEKMEIRLDLSQEAFPTLFLRMELPAGWWTHARHEWWGGKAMSADPRTRLEISRGQPDQAGFHDKTVIWTERVQADEEPAETLTKLANAWIEARAHAGWSIRIPIRTMKPTISMKAGRRTIRVHRGEFAANDHYTITSSTGKSEIDVYQVHGFVAGSQAVLMVTKGGERISELLDGLSLTIRDRPSKTTRQAKVYATYSGMRAKDRDANARLCFRLPKGATPVLPWSPLDGEKVKRDRSVAAEWLVPGREPADALRICLRAESRAAFDLRRQLTFWMARCDDHVLLAEPEESKSDGRDVLDCALRQKREDSTSIVAMHAFEVNGVHWYLSVERAAGQEDEVGSKPWKAAQKVLKQLVKSLEAWETRPFLKPSTAD